VYARLKPWRVASSLLMGLFLGFFRAIAWIAYQLCKRLKPPAELAVGFVDAVNGGIACIGFLADQASLFCSYTAYPPAAIFGMRFSTTC